ncbi:signal transduction histidine kinase [Frigoribacterium sp. PhB160]|uniref:sensor histidine kinase n=1 Tax=Frigoribacterium sp. PhB160 TaxID=2485192 RepID=UPI000F46C36C|nr:ATP-binding protein [Frigoribacterium sp. PhB160]ROS61734.1 signal transduction histidine kinase [Frigoribacterium sp. PhB160]
MLLGLPAHLAPQSTGTALARACHVIATVVLVGAALLLVSAQAASPALVLWPALVALVPLLVLLLVVDRRPGATSSAVYLVLGTACLYWYAVTLFAQVPAVQASDAFSLALPKIALVMVGGSSVRPRQGLAWASVGFVLGEVVTQFATWQTGSAPRLDVTTLLAFALVVVTMGSAVLATDRARRAQPSLHRAAFDQQVQGIRHDMEQQAAAILHDTVLSHLAAVATSRPGPLDPVLARSVAADLETVVGQEWLGEPEPGDSPSASADAWEASDLARAVEQGRDRGLAVGVTGDVGAVARLAPGAGRALGLAVAQCLVNVERHSGVERAEVVVYGDGGELSVMVIDDGAGFDPAAVPADRLGIAGSVQARMARVGGSAQVWSSPGSGTSVIIRVPVVTADAAATASSPAGAPSSAGADDRDRALETGGAA